MCKPARMERWRIYIYEKLTIAIELETSNKLSTAQWKHKGEKNSLTDNKNHGNSFADIGDDDHKTIIDIIIKARNKLSK